MDIFENISPEIIQRAQRIKMVLTDNDGVLTDGGVFYGENGETFKRFNIRDGMGVERLRKHAAVETGIITGEFSPSVRMRSEKLRITELHLGIKDKSAVLNDILKRNLLEVNEIAYIGDDTNDVDVLSVVGLAACPNDAMFFAKQKSHYICENKGGHGAFRELAELIIWAKQQLTNHNL